MNRYPHLLSPIDIAGVTLRNRLMQTAHARHYARDGLESARDEAYFAERARGGVGLIVVGNQVVHPSGGPGRRGIAYTFLRGARDALHRVANAIHEHGAKVFVQLNHFGPSGSSDGEDPRVVWGPSASVSAVTGEQSKAMEPEEIAEAIEAYARAAEMARDAGVDGVELHVAHGYLLNSFLSPLSNSRADAYGGSPENRLRIVREVIAAVRRSVGRDFVLGVRLTLADGLPGGLTTDDSADIARQLASDGSIDFFSVSCGGGPAFWLAAQTGYATPGYLIEQTAQLKQSVPNLPVCVVGGIGEPAQAEEVIAAGKADLVAMTRAQIADPALARKIIEGREDEIVHCIRGNQGCLSRIARGMPMSCTVNPAAGREKLFGSGTHTRATASKRWLVIGGGPAGMKAAEGLALRGHAVTLFEKELRPGGQVNVIEKLPGRAPWASIRDDLVRSLARLRVDIHCGVEATAPMVVDFKADGVIIATGAIPDRSGRASCAPPPVRTGLRNELTLWEAIEAPQRAGKRALLLDDEGSQRVGALAELLLDNGVQVFLVSRLNSLFPATMYTLDMPALYQRVHSKGLKYRLNSWVQRIDADQAVVTGLYGGPETVIDGIGSVIFGTAPHPQAALYDALKGHVPVLHRIGDCVTPRAMDHAIYEGFLAGRELWSWRERPFYEDGHEPEVLA